MKLLVIAGLLNLLLGCALAGNDVPAPMQGQWQPELDTTDIYVSVYVDRMMGVDVKNFRHEQILVFYVSWVDATAAAKVQAATARVQDPAQNYTCRRPCNNRVYGDACCDDIYIPTFVFRNAYDFPNERESNISLYDNGGVMLTEYVHGMFYQPMDYSNYPFLSFDLLVTVQFRDNPGPGHPGVTLHSSSGGPKLYTVGKGDTSADWNLKSLNLQALQVPIGQWFSTWSTLKSDPNDPLPLVGVNSTNIPLGTSIEKWLAVTILVEKFTSSSILNAVLPITICAFLGLCVFFVGIRDLYSRLEMIVVLFLALTAIQFVLSDDQPNSSYITPTQQYILATYVLFAIIAVESITANYMCLARERLERATARKEARMRLSSKHKDNLPTTSDLKPSTTTEPIEQPGPGENGANKGGVLSRLGTKKPVWMQQIEKDEYYAEDVAMRIDCWTFYFLIFGFALTAILIFTLQDGYVDVFTDL